MLIEAPADSTMGDHPVFGGRVRVGLHHEALLLGAIAAPRAIPDQGGFPLYRTRANRKGKRGIGGLVEKQCVSSARKLGSRICKPNSVRGIAPAGRPFLWAAHRWAALATYP